MPYLLLYAKLRGSGFIPYRRLGRILTMAEYLIYKRDDCPGCHGEKRIKKVHRGVEESYDCPMCKALGYLDELVPLGEAKNELWRILQASKGTERNKSPQVL